MTKIIISDAAGNVIASLDRGNFKRFSMQAANDHDRMDAFAAKNANAASAVIGPYSFKFVSGRSQII